MTTNSVNNGDSIVQVMTVLLVFIFVLALTYFVTRWIAKFQKDKLSSKNIELIEASPIGQNRSIQIVRIGDKYLALGIGKEEINVLSELSKDEINMEKNTTQKFPDFKKIFNNSKNLKV